MTRGGKRKDAGRPSKPPGTLAKDLKPVRGIRLTDTEYAKVRQYIKSIRAQEQKGSGSWEEEGMKTVTIIIYPEKEQWKNEVIHLLGEYIKDLRCHPSGQLPKAIHDLNGYVQGEILYEKSNLSEGN